MSSGMFGAEALEHIVQRTLETSPEIPKGARGAFLTVATQDGIRAVIAVRIADQWTVQGAVEVPRGGHTASFEVSVKGTF